MSDEAVTKARKISIVVADDYPVIRRGVVTVLAAQDGLEVLAEAEDAATVVAAITLHHPDVLVLDLGMPGVRGLELLRQIREEFPAMGVLIYTMYREEELALACLKSGANGFLHKTAPEVELVRAVRVAAEGLRYLSPALAERFVAETPLPQQGPAHRSLSDRELHVLIMLAEGKRPAEIAARLGISAKTVHTYRGRILDKLGARTTVDLVLYCAEHRLLGWVPPPERKQTQ
jgi:two-component system invasion response regulator UvrY